MVNTNYKVAFLFPGQGSQYPKMGLDFLAGSSKVRDLFRIASDAAGRDLEELLENSDEETLKRTDVSQIAITIANLASSTFLAERGIQPLASAGFSLGEYAALTVAGVVSLEDCFRLVSARGKAMQKAADRIASESAEGAAPGMAAVLGLAPERVEELLRDWKMAGLKDLYAANFNSPKQVVVAGSAAALVEAETRFKEAGARRVLILKVAGPFHSPLVAEAAADFVPILEATSFADPQTPLFSNVSGSRVSSGAEAKKLALRQITESVRWTTEQAALAALGPLAVLEVGPGKVLQGLWKDSGSSIPAYGAGTLADLEASLAVLAQEQGVEQ